MKNLKKSTPLKVIVLWGIANCLPVWPPATDKHRRCRR
jgi:hypothetical protein